jgi:hypothetical protein
MISELVRATVAEPQVDGPKACDERRGRQICDCRNTNWKRGSLWAASMLANAKPNPHQDAGCRSRRHAKKVQALTRGGSLRESAEGVSRGHSSGERARRPRLADPSGDNDTVNPSREGLKVEDPRRWREIGQKAQDHRNDAGAQVPVSATDDVRVKPVKLSEVWASRKPTALNR